MVVNTPLLPVGPNGDAPPKARVPPVILNVAVEPELFAVTGVIVPFTLTVPLLKVNVGLLAVLLGLELVRVKLPDTLKLVMLEVIVVVAAEATGVTVVPTATDPDDNVPAPVIVQAVLEPAALFNVTALVIVNVTPVLIDNVEPDAVNVKAPAFTLPVNVAVPAVFVIDIVPVVVKSSMLCVPVPLIVMIELPGVKVPLLTKLPPNVTLKFPVVIVAPLFTVTSPGALSAVFSWTVSPLFTVKLMVLEIVPLAVKVLVPDPLNTIDPEAEPVSVMDPVPVLEKLPPTFSVPTSAVCDMSNVPTLTPEIS